MKHPSPRDYPHVLEYERDILKALDQAAINLDDRIHVLQSAEDIDEKAVDALVKQLQTTEVKQKQQRELVQDLERQYELPFQGAPAKRQRRKTRT